MKVNKTKTVYNNKDGNEIIITLIKKHYESNNFHDYRNGMEDEPRRNVAYTVNVKYIGEDESIDITENVYEWQYNEGEKWYFPCERDSSKHHDGDMELFDSLLGYESIDESLDDIIETTWDLVREN